MAPNVLIFSAWFVSTFRSNLAQIPSEGSWIDAKKGESKLKGLRKRENSGGWKFLGYARVYFSGRGQRLPIVYFDEGSMGGRGSGDPKGLPSPQCGVGYLFRHWSPNGTPT